jgi:hypothetical protein
VDEFAGTARGNVGEDKDLSRWRQVGRGDHRNPGAPEGRGLLARIDVDVAGDPDP